MLLVVLLAACSSDSGLTGKQTQDISSFRASANAICDTALASYHSALAQGAAATSSADAAKNFMVSTLLPILDKELGDLHNLGEPTLNKPDWDDIRTKLDASLSDAKAAVASDPVAALKAALAAPTTGTGTSDLDKAMVSFGIEECAKN